MSVRIEYVFSSLRVFHVNLFPGIVFARFLHCMEEKVDYISLSLHDPGLAEKWYLRLRTEILKDLTRFPYKYPLYHVQKWSAKGIRQFTFRNDVTLYSVNEKEQIVYIWAVCTKGRDLTAHLEEYT